MDSRSSAPPVSLCGKTKPRRVATLQSSAVYLFRKCGAIPIGVIRDRELNVLSCRCWVTVRSVWVQGSVPHHLVLSLVRRQAVMNLQLPPLMVHSAILYPPSPFVRVLVLVSHSIFTAMSPWRSLRSSPRLSWNRIALLPVPLPWAGSVLRVLVGWTYLHDMFWRFDAKPTRTFVCMWHSRTLEVA